MLEGFKEERIETGDLTVFARIGPQNGNPMLILRHVYPLTSAMWHGVVETLRDRFDIIAPDLRGYGRSDKPAGDITLYSKRAMAADVIGLMDTLGIARAFVCGHDRGGRVNHR